MRRFEMRTKKMPKKTRKTKRSENGREVDFTRIILPETSVMHIIRLIPVGATFTRKKLC